MTRKERAVELYKANFLCSQSVLAAFAEACGITEQEAFKIGTCFGTGMREGQVCGACTGALMVLGLLYGQGDAAESRKKAYALSERFMKSFREKNGSVICSDLLQCDVTTEEGLAHVHEHNLFNEFCPLMVADAVDVLEEILAEQCAGETK